MNEERMKNRRGEELTLIVKPTLECNQECVYCYRTEDNGNGMRMDDRTLKNVIEKFLTYTGPERGVHFIWHGGEPLLMGMEFFRKVVETQHNIGTHYRIRNGIQSNITLLTEEFLDFFLKHNFGIGTSLDGPQYLHDAQRPYSNGGGTFDDVMRKIELCQRTGKTPNSIGTITVMTRKTLECLDELYDLAVKNRIRVKINPLIYEGRGREVREQLGLRPGEYGTALTHLFDRWFYDGASHIEIDPLSEVLGNLLIGETRSCIFSQECYKYFLEVAPNGDVYPCGSLNPHTFVLGNINTQQPEEMFASPLLEKLQTTRAEARKRCDPCDYLSVCHSGCMRNAFMQNNNPHDHDYYCADYKILYSHAHQLLSKELGTDYAMLAKNWQNIESSPNPALQMIVKTRPYKGPMLWQDKQWAQWRGDWSESHSDHKVHGVEGY